MICRAGVLAFSVPLLVAALSGPGRVLAGAAPHGDHAAAPSPLPPAIRALRREDSPGNTSVTVGRVIFSTHASLFGDRVRVPILVTRGQPAGTATLAGMSGCNTWLRPGAVTWLACPYSGQQAVTVVVRLAGAQVFMHTLAVEPA